MKKVLMSLSPFKGVAAVAVVMSLSIGASPIVAKDDSVLARVNGQPVYAWEVALAEVEIGQELAQVGADQRRKILLRYVIDTRLMAEAGVKAGLENNPAFKQRVQYGKYQALRDTYFEKKVRDSVRDKELRVIYEQSVKKIKPGEEVKARHILVKKEEDALDIIERLNRGDDFITLAKEKSVGPSGSNGGDLGYFQKGRMVKSFEEAAFALQPGEISAPVKSSFGWHVIKVEGRRMVAVPKFEELKGRIKAQLVQQKSREITRGLREAAKIEIVDKKPAKAPKAVK